MIPVCLLPVVGRRHLRRRRVCRVETLDRIEHVHRLREITLPVVEARERAYDILTRRRPLASAHQRGFGIRIGAAILL